MIGAEVILALTSLRRPGARTSALALGGSFERRAMDVAECELEIQVSTSNYNLSAHGEVMMVMLPDRREYYFITAIERRNTYYVVRGETFLRYLRGYHPDRYAGTADAQWSGDAAKGVLVSLRPTENIPVHAGETGSRALWIIVPDNVPPSVNVSVSFAWASRLESAKEITRLAHAQGYPLVWWFEAGRWCDAKDDSGAYRVKPSVALVFAHALPRHGLFRPRWSGSVRYDAWVYDRSQPTAGVALGYGLGIDREVTRARSPRGLFNGWTYVEDRIDGRATGTSAAAQAALMCWRPVEAGAGQVYSQDTPRLGDQVFMVAADNQRCAGVAYVVGERYTVSGARVESMELGVVQI